MKVGTLQHKAPQVDYVCEVHCNDGYDYNEPTGGLLPQLLRNKAYEEIVKICVPTPSKNHFKKHLDRMALGKMSRFCGRCFKWCLDEQ